MKKWECIRVDKHKEVGIAIETMESRGWTLHTFTAAPQGGMATYYFILFYRES